MTPDSLRALLDAAAKATPGPWHQAGIANNERHWMRETRDGNNRSVAWCGTNPEQEAHRNAAYIAAASPDTVAALARIALAAAECDLTLSRVIHELAGAASLCWEPKPTGVFDSSLAIGFCEDAIDELRAILRDGGLHDAGLLTTALQEPQP